ncbi:(R)-mandelonitrile lyase 2-like [Ziziphus jujuba]|uniref:(R)-mandelonitrile lyase n=1 Tax=Ziziphus jujuba TaxID=326968 RepID=A0ABM3ZYA0_ZIZJJ|nr:(R)-mandelonitrile lyase 2-like [Ziziphus jujuba]XP_060669455.1 (R)-mandelonitrile lyase 2-like [Ziziphus jujuba]XP_060669531.1 (R)-mandelonitrile lyase 2-like [Ziziphus jujuba]
MAAALLVFMLSYILHPQLEVLALATSSDHDFSYMKSVYNATDLPLEDVYDYIIIGGGTAGCPLAATLSEKYSVLVLERGSAPVSYPQVLNANGLLTNFLQEDNGKTPFQRFISEDGVPNARGRVLGGSSMINVGFFSRADDQFYNESGIDWDMDLVEKAYQWVEDTIVFRYNLSTFPSIYRKALLEAGVGPDNGFSLKHLVGTKASGSTFDDQGRRHGAVEFLNKGVLKNLRVAVEAYVEKIIFSSSNNASRLSATGVIFTDSKGKTRRASIRDKGEVILSAGAIGSPQLLLISGVGPVPDLSSLHIQVVHSNPDVGNFMADNPRNTISIVVPFALDPSVAQVVGITGDFNIIEAISFNLSFSFPLPFGLFPNSTSPLEFSVANIAEKFSGPKSSGSLRLLSSAEVKVSPAVRFNYFSEVGDLARCVKGMRKVGDLLKTESFKQLKFQDLEGAEGFKFLGPPLPKNQSDDASMETFCRSTVGTFWHYHGGCLVGKVVDGEYRVKGTNSLRVVDGSTFNASPGTNPQATLMMIGRYIGLKILHERKAAK